MLKTSSIYVAALIALILVTQGYYLADPPASTIVAMIIAFSGAYLFNDNAHYLVGRAPSQQFLGKVVSGKVCRRRFRHP
ncbi:MAG: hypothetical protein QXX08_05850 [Candidatus Bathyarchaeia archaeon]